MPITYGSAVKLRFDQGWYLHSLEVQWTGSASGDNIVTTIEDETNPHVYWSVGGKFASGTVVSCGSSIFLSHAVSGKRLGGSAENGRLSPRESGVGAGQGEELIVECDTEVWQKGQKIGLKNLQGKYVAQSSLYTNQNCPRCPIVGQKEVILSASRAAAANKWIVEGGVILQETVEKEALNDEINEETNDDRETRDEL